MINIIINVKLLYKKTIYIRTHKTVYMVNYISLMLFDNCLLLKLLHSLMKEKTLN